MLKKRIIALTLIIVLLSSTIVHGQNSYIDKSNINSGVIKVDYQSNKAVAVRVTKDNESYDYVLNGNNDIPLQSGDGEYTVLVLENVEGTKFKQIAKENVVLKSKNEKDVYLQSIQMINWNKEMAAIKKAEELTKNAKSDKEKVEAIYNYIVKTIKYDNNKATKANINYIPNIDETFSTQDGICYDYASLFAAMTRSQGIPTKLLMGRKNDIKDYHSWNQVYLKDTDKWITIDTTYDAEFVQNNISISMIKDNSEYKIEKTY